MLPDSFSLKKYLILCWNRVNRGMTTYLLIFLTIDLIAEKSGLAFGSSDQHLTIKLLMSQQVSLLSSTTGLNGWLWQVGLHTNWIISAMKSFRLRAFSEFQISVMWRSIKLWKPNFKSAWKFVSLLPLNNKVSSRTSMVCHGKSVLFQAIKFYAAQGSVLCYESECKKLPFGVRSRYVLPK